MRPARAGRLVVIAEWHRTDALVPRQTAGSVRSSPQPPTGASHQPHCLACKKSVGKVLTCQHCQTRVHAGACVSVARRVFGSSRARVLTARFAAAGGVVAEPGAETWTCDLCGNAKSAEASLVGRSRSFVSPVVVAHACGGRRPQNTGCLLCPPRNKSKHLYPSYLRVCKPTEGQGWAHVLCSVFIPEITFSDASRLRVVEGISTIPHSRWSSVRPPRSLVAQTPRRRSPAAPAAASVPASSAPSVFSPAAP